MIDDKLLFLLSVGATQVPTEFHQGTSGVLQGLGESEGSRDGVLTQATPLRRSQIIHNMMI